jgi:cytochrome c-type biogenesis protein
MIEYLISFLGGIFSVFSPCILPVLPLIFATAEGRWWKSVLVVLGMIFSFGILGIVFGVLGSLSGINFIAILVLFLFGVILLLDLRLPRIDSLSGLLGKRIVKNSASSLYPFILGMSLGVVWSPCIGPVLGAIVALVTLSGSVFSGFFLMLSYAFGISFVVSIMLLTGSRFSSNLVRTQPVNRIFGGIILLFLFLMVSGTLDSFEIFLAAKLEFFERWARDLLF